KSLTGYAKSPDVNALLRRQIELVARLDVERLVPGVDVPDDAVHAILARAVLIGDDLLTLGIFTLLFLPRLGVGNEEALITCQAVNDRRFAVLGGVLLVRGIGRLDTRQVADILAERQLAVDREIRERLEAIVLRHERIGLRCEGFGRLGRPPVPKLSNRIELATLVVESMAHFMADDSADRAIIGRGVGVRIEEGR